MSEFRNYEPEGEEPGGMWFPPGSGSMRAVGMHSTGEIFAVMSTNRVFLVREDKSVRELEEHELTEHEKQMRDG